MKSFSRKSRPSLVLRGVAAALLAGSLGLSMTSAIGQGAITLSGAQEVPPVTTAGAGTGMIMIAADHSVSGKVTTTGIAGTMAHIHMAPAGKNGPVIVPLAKNGDEYSVPAGTKLTDEQYAAYQAGNLYVNVHTADNKAGELRVQLKP